MNRKSFCVIASVAAALFCAGPAAATEDEHKASAQQERFAQCSHESKGLKSDERHKFMSECLKGHGAESHATKAASHGDVHHESQQNRMKACNQEAGKKELHGDERRAFMSTCLKG